MKDDKKKPAMAVTKLFGRCVALQINGEKFELKVMGDRADAAKAREKLLAALAQAGAVVIEPALWEGKADPND